jgi:tRNA (guanine37-N1)-methyltransferase
LGDAHEHIPVSSNTAIVLTSAAGKLFRQETARRYAELERVILICGRYEGVDERVAAHLATEEISIGDFVLSGGELAALLVVDAVTRLLPGALGNDASSQNESFSAVTAAGASGETRTGTHQPLEPRREAAPLLDFPHYTRPAEFRGWPVPEVLIGGNHAEVAKWRRTAALEKTRQNRPDLLLP